MWLPHLRISSDIFGHFSVSILILLPGPGSSVLGSNYIADMRGLSVIGRIHRKQARWRSFRHENMLKQILGRRSITIVSVKIWKNMIWQWICAYQTCEKREGVFWMLREKFVNLPNFLTQVLYALLNCPQILIRAACQWVNGGSRFLPNLFGIYVWQSVSC